MYIDEQWSVLYIRIIVPGKLSFHLTALLYPCQPFEGYKELPEVDVSVSMQEPLFSVEEASKRLTLLVYLYHPKHCHCVDIIYSHIDWYRLKLYEHLYVLYMQVWQKMELEQASKLDSGRKICIRTFFQYMMVICKQEW